jgi:hypothetical protein
MEYENHSKGTKKGPENALDWHLPLTPVSALNHAQYSYRHANPSFSCIPLSPSGCWKTPASVTINGWAVVEHAWHVTAASRVLRSAYVELSSSLGIGRCCLGRLHRSHCKAVTAILNAGTLFLISSGSIAQERAFTQHGRRMMQSYHSI